MSQVTRPNAFSFGNGCFIFNGSGDPNLRTDDDTVAAKVGSLYLRVDGAPSATLYVVESRTVNPISGESIAVWTAK